MEHFDVEVRIANLINSFPECVAEGSVKILEWFYDAINYRSIFESRFGESILATLRSNGYAGVTSKTEELESFKNLMQSDEDKTSEAVASTLISLIIKSLTETSTISPYLEQLICIYNEKYNNEKTYQTMMDKLNTNIGNEVVFVLIKNGVISLESGKLESVDSFNQVVIDGTYYPFVGENTEINKISDCDGQVLYSNITSSPKDDLSNETLIEKKKLKLFGNNYKEDFKIL